MPIEPALHASAGRMPKRAGTERAEARMAEASVRRDGMGNPEPGLQPLRVEPRLRAKHEPVGGRQERAGGGLQGIG